ncbi:MAG: DNA endonuclease SmrA, partial [Shewanella sp.]
MLDEGAALFFAEMADVVPLKGAETVVNRQPMALTAEQLQRRAALRKEAFLAYMPLDLSLIPVI